MLRAFHALQRGRHASLAATAAAAAAAAPIRRLASAAGEGGGSSGSGGNDSGGAGAADDPAARLAGMLDVMLKDDSAREALLARLPERMRRPEVVRAMLQNPEVRARLGELARQTGMFSAAGGGGGGDSNGGPSLGAPLPDAAALERGLAAARAAGIDAGKVAARLATSSPALRRAAGNPRVFAALMDICRGGDEALRRYEGDQEVLRAWFEAGTALQEVQAEARAGAGAGAAATGGGGGGSGGGSGGAESTSGSSGSSNDSSVASSSSSSSSPGNNSDDNNSAAPALGGAAEAAALRALVADPALAARLSNPRVRAALQEVAASPLKAVKYMFDPEVREALAAARRLVKDAAGK